MSLSFTEVVGKFNLQNEATSKLKKKQVLNNLGESTYLYMRDSIFTSNDGFLKKRPTKRTHWTVYTNEYYSQSYGCPPPKFYTFYINKRNRKCVVFRIKIQKKQMLCFLFICFLLDRKIKIRLKICSGTFKEQ